MKIGPSALGIIPLPGRSLPLPGEGRREERGCMRISCIEPRADGAGLALRSAPGVGGGTGPTFGASDVGEEVPPDERPWSRVSR
jgi:hypothetical protein